MKKIFLFTLLVLSSKNILASGHSLLPPPSNDECAGAMTLNVNSDEIPTDFTTVNFIQATVSPEGGICTSLNSGDVWYEFTATSTSQTIALSNFTGTPKPMVIVLYEGDCSSLNPVYCSQNNVINASGLTVGNLYKIRIYFNSTTASLANTFSVYITTPPPPTDNNQTDCLITTINYDFESPLPSDLTTTHPFFYNHNVVQGWRTTAADQIIEFWPSPNYQNHPSYSGNQFIELNANMVSGIYQDYSTPQPTVFNYGFAHKGRNGVDTCKLLAGPPGGPYTTVTTVSTGVEAWSYNTGTYAVPANQPVTRFIFQSVSSVGGATIGNFLDAISFTANNGILTQNPYNMDCDITVANLEAAGTGTWVAHTENPSPTVFSDSQMNNVEITGFSVPGSYYYDWVTEYCISTIELVYSGPIPSIPAVADITYCQNQVATAVNIIPDEETNIINYYLDGNLLSEAPIPDTSVIGSTTYEVNQVSVSGCESEPTPFTVTINPLQEVVTDFTLPSNLCTTDESILPTISQNFTEGGVFSAPLGIVLDPQTGQITPEDSEPGIYEITYTVIEDIENCMLGSSSSTEIAINAIPVLQPIADYEICDDNNDGFMIFDLTQISASVTENQSDIISYFYDNNGSMVEITNPETFQNTVSGGQTIWVTVENTNGCTAVTSFDLITNQCFIQRGISPNGDGMNDFFDLTGLDVMELNIFNRYGEKVYSYSNYTNEWGGQTDKGKELPTGTYYYSIKFSAPNPTYGSQHTGWIYINREVK